MTALCCLWIAAKNAEIDPRVPGSSKFTSNLPPAVFGSIRNQLKPGVKHHHLLRKVEIFMLETLSWDIYSHIVTYDVLV